MTGLSPGLYTGVSVSDKVYEDQSLLPGISVSNPGYSGLSLDVYTRISTATKYIKTCQLLVHCTPMYQSVTWHIHLEWIHVDLSEYRSATKYTKTCQLCCFPVFQSVTQDITACHPECFCNIGQWQSIDVVYPGVSFSVSVNYAGYGRSGVYARVSTYL